MATTYIKKSDKEVLRNLNWDLSNLYFYLDYLNNSLDHYNNKKWLYNWTPSFRKKQIDEIRERIPDLYKDINEVKASIAEMKRRMNKNTEDYINRHNNSYNNEYQTNLEYNDVEYDDVYFEDNYNQDYTDNYDYYIQEDNYYAQEDIPVKRVVNEVVDSDEDDYKYNPVTGAFE